jgi:hypothetical protein
MNSRIRLVEIDSLNVVYSTSVIDFVSVAAAFAIDSPSTIQTASPASAPPTNAPPASAAADEEENKMASARHATMHTPTVPDFPRPGDWVVALCVT